jgi:spore maturation protein CgeB
MRLLLVGNEGGTNIGPSLRRAAETLGHEVRYEVIANAFAGPALVRRASWHLLGRRPPRLRRFSRSVLDTARAFEPHVLVATGTAPVTRADLQRIRALGTIALNYLTDDPWNPAFCAGWLLESMAGYDHVFSPRKTNIPDLEALRAGTVHYLPFAYDPDLFFPAPPRPAQFDVIFAAAADADRIPYVHALLQRGYRVGLFGDYWERFRETRGRAGEWLEPARLRPAIAASRLALCLVRRANRDGHVMRTYELAALRACIVAEDTGEQRAILGEAATYFRDPNELLERVDHLLAQPALCAHIAQAAHERITRGANTYRDRLLTMLGVAEPRAS